MKDIKFAWLYILLIALALQLFLPWWSIALAAGAVGTWIGYKPSYAFLSGFAGISLLWVVTSTYIHLANEGILAGRVAEMMGLPNAVSIILVTGLIGGLAGGFSAMTGFLLKDAFTRPVGIEKKQLN